MVCLRMGFGLIVLQETAVAAAAVDAADGGAGSCSDPACICRFSVTHTLPQNAIECRHLASSGACGGCGECKMMKEIGANKMLCDVTHVYCMGILVIQRGYVIPDLCAAIFKCLYEPGVSAKKVEEVELCLWSNYNSYMKEFVVDKAVHIFHCGPALPRELAVDGSTTCGVELPMGTKWFNVGAEVPAGVQKYLAYKKEQHKQAGDARQDALGTGAPTPWDEIFNERLAAALHTKIEFFGDKIEFTAEQFAGFGAAGVSLNSYIKAGAQYFKPVRNIKMTPVETTNNTHHTHRSRAMEIHEKKHHAKGVCVSLSRRGGLFFAFLCLHVACLLSGGTDVCCATSSMVERTQHELCGHRDDVSSRTPRTAQEQHHAARLKPASREARLPAGCTTSRRGQRCYVGRKRDFHVVPDYCRAADGTTGTDTLPCAFAFHQGHGGVQDQIRWPEYARLALQPRVSVLSTGQKNATRQCSSRCTAMARDSDRRRASAQVPPQCAQYRQHASEVIRVATAKLSCDFPARPQHFRQT